MIGFSQGQARAGAVLVVEADYAEMGREAATAAKRALAGSGSGCWICATSRAWTPAACQPR